MQASFTIGQRAHAAGIPTSTVRYYERCRLVPPGGRTPSNYRVYGPDALRRLHFIRAARATGFTLEDVAALLAFRDGRTAPCKEVQTLIRERLADLVRRLEHLVNVRAVLRTSLRLCRQAEESGRCRVIERLDRAPASPQVGRPGGSGRERENPLDLEPGFKV